MLLTYNAPGGKEIWAAMSEAERAAEEAEYRDLIRSMRDERIFLAAEEVEHHNAARTVRLRDGSLSVSDGPAVNADAFLTGYFLIEVESLDNAINWAARIPNARTGSVEVRPVMTSTGNGSTAHSDPTHLIHHARVAQGCAITMTLRPIR